MNKLLWIFFEFFFKFQHICCFSFKSDKIVNINRKLILYSVLLPNFSIIIYASAIISGQVHKLVLIETLKLDNVSILITRILKLFPLLIFLGCLITNNVTMNCKKLQKSAKILYKLKHFVSLDLKSKKFQEFEIRSLVLFIVYYSSLLVGLTMNSFSLMLPTATSFAFLTISVWNMYLGTHIMFLFVLFVDFISTIVSQIENEIMKNCKNISLQLHKLVIIDETVDRIRKNLRFLVSHVLIKFMIEILQRVSWA